MELVSQKMRKLAPELDPLRIGTGSVSYTHLTLPTNSRV